MTTIPFTTLLIVVLAVPGYVFLSNYNSGPFSKGALARDWTKDIVLFVLWSLPFHLVMLTIVDHTYHAGLIHVDMKLLTIAQLIAGQHKQFDQLVHTFYQNVHEVLFYYVAVLGLAWFFGYAFRRVVWDRQLDVRFPTLFSYGNEWMYKLTGRGIVANQSSDVIVLPYLDVLVEVAGKTKLYRGVFYDFSADARGAPESIFLIETLKGRFRSVQGAPDEFYWQRIPGQFFVLRYEEIKSLNITYYSEKEGTDEQTGVSLPSKAPPEEKR